MSDRVKQRTSIHGSMEDLFAKPNDNVNEPDISPNENNTVTPKTTSKNDDKQTIGANGGIIGRPKSKHKKVQAHVTCTQEELDMFKLAAEKDHRTFPSFVNAAIYEYIENHGLK